MSVRVVAGFLFMVLGAAYPGAAQTAATFVDAANGLSLDQAVARALAHEPSIRAARTAIDEARAMRLQAGLRRNPSVSAEVREEPTGTDSQRMVSVAWPLDLFRRDGRIAVADRELAAAELSVADRERLLAADVRARFGETLVALRGLTVLDELVDATRRQHELLRARVEQGASPPLERDLVDVELRRLTADRALQLGTVERTVYELKRILGVSPADVLRLRDTLEDVVRSDAAAVPPASGAEPPRADVREAAALVAVADARIDRAERDGRFDVSLFGGYMRMDSGFPQFGLSAAGQPERVQGVFHYVTGGAMVMLPLFNRNQGEVAAAQAGRSGAVARQEAATLSAETEVATARVLDQRAREAVELYAGDARSLARQNLSVIRQSYDLGRTTIFEVLAEQKRYLELERALTDTLRAAYEARTALTRAIGGPR